MSKAANAGELRTPVRFVKLVSAVDDEGYPAENEEDVFDKPVLVKWVNAHGTESFAAMQLQLREPATVTMRYSPEIDTSLILYKRNDPKPYEIISVDNVGERDAWLELKVQRKEAAR